MTASLGAGVGCFPPPECSGRVLVHSGDSFAHVACVVWGQSWPLSGHSPTATRPAPPGSFLSAVLPPKDIGTPPCCLGQTAEQPQSSGDGERSRVERKEGDSRMICCFEHYLVNTAAGWG